MESTAMLVSIYKDQTAIVNGLWTIYQAVSLASLGYVFSQEFVRKSPWILGLLTAIYLFFSIANQRAIVRSQEIIYAASSELKMISGLPSTDRHLRSVLSAYDAVPASELMFAHYAFSSLVVSAFWVLFAVSYFQGRKANSLSQGA